MSLDIFAAESVVAVGVHVPEDGYCELEHGEVGEARKHLRIPPTSPAEDAQGLEPGACYDLTGGRSISMTLASTTAWHAFRELLNTYAAQRGLDTAFAPLRQGSPKGYYCADVCGGLADDLAQHSFNFRVFAAQQSQEGAEVLGRLYDRLQACFIIAARGGVVVIE